MALGAGLRPLRCRSGAYEGRPCVTTGASSRIHSLVLCVWVFFFFLSFTRVVRPRWEAMESALPAAGFLYWVGASTVAYLALRISYSLFTAFQVWGLAHAPGVGPELGEWAGESAPAPPRSLFHSCSGSRGRGPGLAGADQSRAPRVASSPRQLPSPPSCAPGPPASRAWLCLDLRGCQALAKSTRGATPRPRGATR